MSTGVNRRLALKRMGLAGLAAVTVPGRLIGQAATIAKDSPANAAGLAAQAAARWNERLLAYLETLARPDGGYAWHVQARSHLTPTFAVVGCYHLLGTLPRNKSALAKFIRSHHPSRLKKLEQEHREFEFQQIQALHWLGEDVSSFAEQVKGWTRPTTYLKQYEQHGHPVFAHEVTAFTCRKLLELPLDDLRPAYVDYLESRQRSNGSFNSAPAAEGGDGHVVNTWWGLQALRTLGRADENKEKAVAWLRACQSPNGGFTWQPKPEFAGVDDVFYTWAAVQSLKLLGSGPAQRDKTIEYIWSLANSDGGFGDRPGWRSSPMATYYALETLSTLDALDLPVRRRAYLRPPSSLPSDLKVFSIQLEAHGTGSPTEAVDLARALRIHLWGAKNASPRWLARAQALADQQNVPVQFFVSNEEYGTWLHVPGIGTYSHTSDIIAPAGTDFGPSLATQGAVSWPQFREGRLIPLQRANGRLIWQFGENEVLVRLLLDDSLERGGFAAISTFHFGNPDFTNSEPFLHRYGGRVPFVALQDAHGEEPWWFADMTTGFRTLFLAKEPTWEGWLKALEQNRVAAVRHDAVSGHETWTHGGPEVLEFIRRHENSWRWWDNPDIQRPLVSIVAVRPQDEFEVGRPEKGVTIRVRCAWENTTQGRPKKPLAELIKLTVDGSETTATLGPEASPQGALRDYHHEFCMREPKPGRHTATAVFRELATLRTSARTVEFTV